MRVDGNEAVEYFNLWQIDSKELDTLDFSTFGDYWEKMKYRPSPEVTRKHFFFNWIAKLFPSKEMTIRKVLLRYRDSDRAFTKI